MRRLTIVLALMPLMAIAAPVQAQTEMVTVTPAQIGEIFCAPAMMMASSRA